LRVGIVFLIALVIPGGRGFGQASPEPRVVKFARGTAVITSSGDHERVEMRTADGRVAGLSVCGGATGSYDDIVAFGKIVRELVIVRSRSR
jgi:hypothetical protein